jgi:hypothetical protein
MSIDVGVPGGQVVNIDGGDTLIYPFYTTKTQEGGAVGTNFSLSNTSDQTVMVKLRFREQTVCRDVLDFIAVLSPYDDFSFTVMAGGDGGRPVLRWQDNSCLVVPDPVVDVPAANGRAAIKHISFPATSGASAEEMAAGHLEIFGIAALGDAGSMAVVDHKSGTEGINVRSCVNDRGVPNGRTDCSSPVGTNISLAAAARHNANGMPPNCDIINKFVGVSSSVRAANTINVDRVKYPNHLFFGDAPNSLMGRYLVTIDGEGIEAGADPVTIRNSDVTNEVWRDAGDVERSLVRYVTSQTSDPCFNADSPNAATRNCRGSKGWDDPLANSNGRLTNTDIAPTNWAYRDWDQPDIGSMPTTPAQGAQLQVNRLANLQTWTRYGADGVDSSLSGPWSINPVNNVSVNWIISFPVKYVYFSGGNNGSNPRAPAGREVGLPVGVAWPSYCPSSVVPRFWDREENEAFSFRVSPGGSILNFCNEVNVLNLHPDDVVPLPSMIQTTKYLKAASFFFDSEVTEDVRGWAWMPLAMRGAVVGMSFTTRATDRPEDNNGSLTELKRGIQP